MDENQDSFVKAISADIVSRVKHTKSIVERLANSFGIINKNLVKELTELAIVIRARELANNARETILQRFQSIVSLYQTQVNLSQRTSHSILLQQYSTAAPIAYMAGVYVSHGLSSNDIIFEPSAGNGLLTIAFQPSQVIVNEVDDIRLNNLLAQKFLSIGKKDATEPFVGYWHNFQGVITNPPFGTLDKSVDYAGYPIKTLDHLMALRALDCMKDSGRAAIIIGGHTVWDEKGRIQAGKNRIFFSYLYEYYIVDDVININGDLYSRQGTSFDVRLILIQGRKTKPEGFAPLQRNTDVIINDFDALYHRVVQFVNPADKEKQLRLVKAKARAKLQTLELMNI